MRRRILVCLPLLLSVCAAQLPTLQKPSSNQPCSTEEATPCAVTSAPSNAAVKPKVRAITAFIRIDTKNYQSQVGEALKFLRAAKTAMEKAGYEVETIRITTQPFPEYVRGMSADAALRFFKQYDDLAVKEGFDAAIGPAIFPGHKGLESDQPLGGSGSPMMSDLLARVIAQSKILEGSVQVSDGRSLDWDAIDAAARIMKYLEENTARSQGNFNFTAAALVPEDTPFFPASWHDGPGKQFALALESANIVANGLSKAHMAGDPAPSITSELAPHAQKIQAAAESIAKQTGWAYEGIDLSPAPLKDISIGAAMEQSGRRIGSPGTLTTAAAITRGLKAVPVKQVGYSGLMFPILEDSTLAQRWGEDAINMDALLSYSAVCGTGLDTIPLPGDVAQSQLDAIIGDVASLAVKWHKPLAARLLPVKGKTAGDKTEFDDPFLVNTVLQKMP